MSVKRNLMEKYSKTLSLKDTVGIDPATHHF